VPRQPHQLFDTPEEKALLESRNALLQFDEVKKLVATSVSSGFSLSPETLLQLQYLAIHDIYDCAGNFRSGPVYLARNGVVDDKFHQPPPPEQVAPLVQEMCDHVNHNFGKPALHLAAYVMWRHNWIHPFFGGNGRTSRAISYFVLCARVGYDLPGNPTVPQQIADSQTNRDRYINALHAADDAYSHGAVVDVSQMEALVSDCLGAQLYTVHQAAATPK
jgi:Fic family protein